MSGGFNTDIRAGGKVYHVQTENRPKALSIDTAVYVKGRLVHSQSLSYATPEKVAGLEGEELLWRVEEEHRQIVEAIREGSLAMNVPQGEAAGAGGAGKTPGIEGVSGASAGSVAAVLQLRLVNRTSWISGSNADLQIEVRGADGQKPASGAQLEALLEGSAAHGHRATTDVQGRARIQFALPEKGKGATSLLIRAMHPSGRCEVRFALREKAKTAPNLAPKAK